MGGQASLRRIETTKCGVAMGLNRARTGYALRCQDHSERAFSGVQTNRVKEKSNWSLWRIDRRRRIDEVPLSVWQAEKLIASWPRRMWLDKGRPVQPAEPRIYECLFIQPLCIVLEAIVITCAEMEGALKVETPRSFL